MMKSDITELDREEAKAFLRFLMMERIRHEKDIETITKHINRVACNFNLEPDKIDVWEFIKVEEHHNPR